MKRILLTLLFSLFFLFPVHASADEGWQIDRFHSDIAIQQTGIVRVVETIDVDFAGLSKHGIYRDIPYIYLGRGRQIYTDIHIESVLQNNVSATYDDYTNNGYLRLKIGDGDKTISGKNSYTITYTAKGILRTIGDHDELYWNVTGNNWGVPISTASAVVTLDKGEVNKSICYEGETGSPSECRSSLLSPQVAEFASLAQLAPSQGMTIAVSYPSGIIPVLTVEKPKSAWDMFIEWPSLATLFAAIVAGIAFVFYRWYKFGRDYWFGQNIFGTQDDHGHPKPVGSHETITVEFTPPAKLRPAEMGVLLDERADTTDVVATIIDLATRGYLNITEIPKKWMFGSVDYELKQKTKSTEGLLGYEKMLLDKLFTSGTTQKMSDLKETFYKDLKEVKSALYKEVVAKKLFPSDPEHVRSTYLGIGIVLAIAAIMIFIFSFSVAWIFVADIAFGLIVMGILFIIMAFFMPRRTAYGRELYRRTKGYRLFINTAEKHRQVFFEKKNMFNEVLPYAIMFGLTKKFAQQMQDMGIKPGDTGWYIGSQPFHANTFAANMNSFAGSMSSAMASSPSSSGGFSGGGSGGGFGGGGGGSW